jgi:hypothetical protein
VASVTVEVVVQLGRDLQASSARSVHVSDPRPETSTRISEVGHQIQLQELVCVPTIDGLKTADPCVPLQLFAVRALACASTE